MSDCGPYSWVLVAHAAPEPCHTFVVRDAAGETHRFLIRRRRLERTGAFHRRARRRITRSLEAQL